MAYIRMTVGTALQLNKINLREKSRNFYQVGKDIIFFILFDIGSLLDLVIQ